MKTISLYISPCPNDCFVFHAMLHGLVEVEELAYNVTFEDIETLNQRAIEGSGDVIKASVAVARKIDYTLLDSGSALGHGNGPIVVALNDSRFEENAPSSIKVAIPGINTTAALLFKRYFPHFPNLISMPFHAIARAVQEGRADLGVLIHEGRFTFSDMGLSHLADLGELWERETQLPIPLGAIFASNRLDPDTIKKVERTIARSTLYALQNREASADFVRSHARELSDEVLQNHIDFFVNDFTLSLGANGRQAIATILESIERAK